MKQIAKVVSQGIEKIERTRDFTFMTSPTQSYVHYMLSISMYFHHLPF